MQAFFQLFSKIIIIILQFIEGYTMCNGIHSGEFPVSLQKRSLHNNNYYLVKKVEEISPRQLLNKNNKKQTTMKLKLLVLEAMSGFAPNLNREIASVL